MARSALLAMATLLLVTTSPVSARTWYITPDGTGDAPTIQAGVDSSAVGDTVLVACGTYSDCSTPDPLGGVCCVLISHEIVLRGETGQTDCVTLSFSAGRGLFISSPVVVEGLTIHSNEPTEFGTAVYCIDASPVFENCTFFRNYAESGGAVCSDGGHLMFRSCTFRECASLYAGGAMTVRNGSASLDDCLFVDNYSAIDAGAIYAGGSSLSLSSVHFLGNSAIFSGGAILANSTNLEAQDCDFEGSTGEGGSGGAVHLASGEGRFQDCTFIANWAQIAGGVATYASSVSFDACLFCGNSSYGPMPGGGLYLSGTTATVSGSLITANNGAGLYCSSGSNTLVTRTTIAGNSNMNGPGGVDCWSSAIDFRESIIWDNSPVSMRMNTPDDHISFHCTDGDTVGFLANGGTLSWDPQSFSADPLFCDSGHGPCTDPPAEQRFSIAGDSPCAPPGVTGCGLIGALPVGCGPIAVEPLSWGKIKGAYR